MGTKILEDLKKTGLSAKAALVYEYLIQEGGAYPSRISHDTKLNRSTVYKILVDLSIQGLVNEIEKGKKLFYEIGNIDALIRLARTKAERAHDEYKNAEAILPLLEGLIKTNQNKPRILYFTGKDGVISVFADHLTERGYEMLAWTNTGEILNFLPKKFLINYAQTKKTLKIMTRGILPNQPDDKTYVSNMYASVPEKYWPKVKHIPKETFPFQGDITIYGKKKVSIVNLTEGIYTAIIIEDETIHNIMRMIFELSWKGI